MCRDLIYLCNSFLFLHLLSHLLKSSLDATKLFLISSLRFVLFDIFHSQIFLMSSAISYVSLS